MKRAGKLWEGFTGYPNVVAAAHAAAAGKRMRPDMAGFLLNHFC